MELCDLLHPWTRQQRFHAYFHAGWQAELRAFVLQVELGCTTPSGWVSRAPAYLRLWKCTFGSGRIRLYMGWESVPADTGRTATQVSVQLLFP